jgi:hypothetical protein
MFHFGQVRIIHNIFICKDIMNCDFCNKRLRRCKFELIENRTFHYCCYDKWRQKKYEQELEEFLEWFKHHGVIVRV